MREELSQIEMKIREWESVNEAMCCYYKGQALQLKTQVGYLEAELKLVEE